MKFTIGDIIKHKNGKGLFKVFAVRDRWYIVYSWTKSIYKLSAKMAVSAGDNAKIEYNRRVKYFEDNCCVGG